MPARPQRSSRGMLVFCTFVFIALAGVAVFMDRAGAQKREFPSTQKFMSNPSTATDNQSKNNDELRKKLTPEQFEVTQMCGTEPPFQNAYWDNHAAGIYVDLVSGEPLFSSLDKFDSGTGWPSFSKPIDKARLAEKPDLTGGRERTEVRSGKSDSHLGHVFDDGPGPAHQRYCINSAALRFIPAEKLQEEGYGEYLPQFEKKK